MKSDQTTMSAGYASVFGFNLRQISRYLAGEVRPKIGERVVKQVNLDQDAGITDFVEA